MLVVEFKNIAFMIPTEAEIIDAAQAEADTHYPKYKDTAKASFLKGAGFLLQQFHKANVSGWREWPAQKPSRGSMVICYSNEHYTFTKYSETTFKRLSGSYSLMWFPLPACR